MNKLRQVYADYPQQFWLLVGAAFIDSIGGALLFPFFSLYFTEKFDLGMTRVGFIFTLFAVGGVAGNALGGALADKWGRRNVRIFGLVMSALANLVMGLLNDFNMIYGVAIVAGVLSSVSWPATNAMVADLLPAEKRADGYGLLRVTHNLAVMLGPMVGGFLAAVSYLLLFGLDTLFSLIAAVIVLWYLRETIPTRSDNAPSESFRQTFRGYRLVFHDIGFLFFALLTLVLEIVYFQMNSTLGVYLRDFHAISPQKFGLIISINAGMVVALQFWFTRRIRPYPPLLVMAVAAAFYAFGFGMYGFFGTFGLFIVAMVVITIGEMLAAPVGQALAAEFAPEDMRGRYMAVYSVAYIIPAGVAPVLAGLLMDNGGAKWLWYGCIVIGLVAAAGFVALHRRQAGQLAQPLPILPAEAHI